LCKDLCQQIRLLCQEDANVLLSFRVAALLASQREIADAIIDPNGARNNVLNLQWDVFFP